MQLPTIQSGLMKALQQYTAHKGCIKIAIIGCGEMGTDLIVAFKQIEGLQVAAVCDRTAEKVINAIKIAYQLPDIAATKDYYTQTSSYYSIEDIINAGKIAITSDLSQILNAESIDIIIDATGNPNAGAEIGVNALNHGKHLIMMNVEADVTIGRYLAKLADEKGLVYSLGAGDEPSACMELINFASSLGYPIVAAGKGKNNPLNFYATPDMYEEEARNRNMNPRMLVEFIDGSKTMVEMAAIANATGLIPDCDGMHGQAIPLKQLADRLIPIKDGGILQTAGVVDYSISPDIAPGVFAIIEVNHPRLRERFIDLKVGANSKYFTLYRPYHLTSLEIPLTCARIMLYGQSDMRPLATPTAEVCAKAKRDLAPGEILGKIGQSEYHAWTLHYAKAQALSAIPCGLLEGAKVIAPIQRGELFTSQNIQIDQFSSIAKLHKLQSQTT